MRHPLVLSSLDLTEPDPLRATMPASPAFSDELSDELADDTVQRYYYIYDSRQTRTMPRRPRNPSPPRA